MPRLLLDVLVGGTSRTRWVLQLFLIISRPSRSVSRLSGRRPPLKNLEAGGDPKKICETTPYTLGLTSHKTMAVNITRQNVIGPRGGVEESARNARDPKMQRQFEETALEWRAIAARADKPGTQATGVRWGT